MLALHILNISIDPPDAHPDFIAEDLSYNETESVVELILEDVLGIENACAEKDEHDSPYQIHFDKKIDFFYENQLVSKIIRKGDLFESKPLAPYSKFFHPRIGTDELFQPPEA